MSEFVETLAEQYNLIAEDFSVAAEKYCLSSRKAFYDVLNFDFTNQHLLDVACGNGYDLEEYQRRGAITYELDASKEFIECIRKRVDGINLNVGFMENMPYPDNYFDIVLSKYALQTSYNVPKVIEEITRILKPGGILAYLTVHPYRQFIEKKKYVRIISYKKR